MKLSYLFGFLLLNLLAFIQIIGQDTIVFSDMSIQVGKVIEVNMKTVKFTRSEIKDGPVYEVKREDILIIKYPGGYKDVFNKKSLQIMFDKERARYSQLDTIGHAEIYIVFNYGLSDDQRFPLYFNNVEVCTLKNRSRLKAIIYSEGLLRVERYSRKKNGPGAIFQIEKGRRYGIEIIINDPYGLDPNHRFHISVYDDPVDVNYFISTKYNSFEPDPSRDIIVGENSEQPWIWEE